MADEPEIPEPPQTSPEIPAGVVNPLGVKGQWRQFTEKAVEFAKKNKIDPNLATMGVPLLGAVLGGGFFLLMYEPVTALGKLIMQPLISGLGWLEPVGGIGLAASGLAGALEGVGAFVAPAAAMIASYMTYRALETDAPPAPPTRNLDEQEKERNKNIPPVVLPNRGIPSTPDKTTGKKGRPGEVAEPGETAEEARSREAKSLRESKARIKNTVAENGPIKSGWKEWFASTKLSKALTGGKSAEWLSKYNLPPRALEKILLLVENDRLAREAAGSGARSVAESVVEPPSGARVGTPPVEGGVPGGKTAAETPPPAPAEGVPGEVRSSFEPMVMEISTDGIRRTSPKPGEVMPADAPTPRRGSADATAPASTAEAAPGAVAAPGSVKTPWYKNIARTYKQATAVGHYFNAAAMPVLAIMEKNAANELASGKYKRAELNGVFAIEEAKGTYNRVTKVFEDTQEEGLLSQLGILHSFRYRICELQDGKMPDKIKVENDIYISDEGNAYILDPDYTGRMVLHDTNAAGATLFTSGEVATMLSKIEKLGEQLAKRGVDIKKLGRGLKGAGGGLMLGATSLIEGIEIANLANSGLRDKAVTHATLAVGELAIAVYVPGGVLLVVAEKLAVGQVDAVLAEVAATFPEAQTLPCITDKDGNLVPLTLANAYQLNPHFKSAVEMQAISGSIGVSEEKRKARLEEMLNDPLYAWVNIWNHKHENKREQLNLDTPQGEKQAREKLKEFAKKTKEMVTPDSAWATLHAYAALFLEPASFGVIKGPDFTDDARDGDLRVIAQELLIYDRLVNPSTGKTFTRFGTTGQSSEKGATGAPTRPKPLPSPNVPGYVSETQVGFLAYAAELEKLLKDGMVSGFTKKKAENISLLMRYDAQRQENTSTFIQEVRHALDPSESDLGGRNKLIAGLNELKDNAGKKLLTEAEANALIVETPDLRVTVLPGEKGFNTDGSDATKMQEAFAEKFQEFYGVVKTLLTDTGGKLIATAEETKFVGKAFNETVADQEFKKTGTRPEVMSATEKLEFLKAALQHYNERMDVYKARRQFRELDSKSKKFYIGHTYTQDGRAGFFDSTLKPSSPDGVVETSYGPKSLREEHAFLHGEVFNHVAAATGAKLCDNPKCRMENGTFPVERKRQSNGIAEISDSENDKNREVMRKHLKDSIDGLAGLEEKYAQSLLDEEMLPNGKIRRYIRGARFMEASLQSAEKGIILLTSNLLNNGIDPTTESKRDGSWILFKDMRNGKYHYAEGEWEAYDGNTKSKKEDLFRVTHITDKETGEQIVAGGAVIHLPDGSGNERKDQSAPLLLEAIDQKIQRSPKDTYNEMRTRMLASLAAPAGASPLSPNKLEISSYESLEGDTTLTFGKEACIRCVDSAIGLDYAITGTWGVSDDGKRILLPSAAIVRTSLDGKAVEIPLYADENLGFLREKILKEYKAEASPQEQREVALRRYGESDEAKKIAVDAIKQKFAQWIDAGMVQFEYDPKKQTDTASDDRSQSITIGDRKSSTVGDFKKAVAAGSAVVLNLLSEEKQELQSLLRDAKIHIPGLEQKMETPAVSDAPDELVLVKRNGVTVAFNEVQSLLPAEITKQYCVACANYAKAQNSALSLPGINNGDLFKWNKQSTTSPINNALLPLSSPTRSSFGENAESGLGQFPSQLKIPLPPKGRTFTIEDGREQE